MARFSNFNSLVQSNSQDDEDEEESKGGEGYNDLRRSTDEGDDKEIEDGAEEDMFKHLEQQNRNQHHYEDEGTFIKEEHKLDEQYTDNNFWKTDHLGKSIDELMAEMSL